jgi:hypothetical protein
MAATSPGRWPVSSNTRSAAPCTPALPNADQNAGISLSAKIRSLLFVWLRSTPRQGLVVTKSSFMPHVKTAEAAANT